MMTEIDYCNAAIGKPWINRAEGPDAFDCWGLVLDSFRKIDGVELPSISGYASGATTASAVSDSDMQHFKPTKPANGVIALYYDHKGLAHVGRILFGRVLHATEGLGVKWDRIEALARKPQFIKVEYFKYEPHSTQA